MGLLSMRLLQPGSFLGLILTAFGLVSVPLVLVLLHAYVTVVRLQEQNSRGLHLASRATQEGRALVEQMLDLERKTRQLVVLADARAEVAHEEKLDTVRATVNRLSELPLPAEQRRGLDLLAEKLVRLSRAARLKEAVSARDPFPELNDLARENLSRANALVFHQAEESRATVEGARRVLLAEAAALIPVAAGLAVWFTILLTRPVRQVRAAIDRLGEGDLDSPVSVAGPRDLEALGRRLDWLRRRLAEGVEQKRRFLAHVSHDLKTPLTAVREGAELLLEEAAGPLTPDQREVAGILRENSLKLQRSILELVDFSVAHARGEIQDRVPVPLVGLVEEVLADHRPTLLKKEITLETAFEPAQVEGDRDRLRVAVDNLISNAVKFTPAGGRIAVSVRRAADRALVEVLDSGPGIAAEDRERLFEAFYQGKSRSEGTIKGSGLGLSIAMEYVRAHGGAIEAVDGDGGGALFRVSLPTDGEGAA